MTGCSYKTKDFYGFLLYIDEINKIKRSGLDKMTMKEQEEKLSENWKKFQEWQEEQENTKQPEQEQKNKAKCIFDTWPENLRIFFKDRGTQDFFSDFFIYKLDDIKVENEKIPEPSEITFLCRNYAYSGFDAGLLIGYAFSRYLDKPLQKFRDEAERISKHELKSIKELTEQWNKDCRI
ncbi:MAG TPA: hypothetical protein PKJ95_05180 [Atribacterota bacterium]|nr:hypothetical protein [Atribacterota bacterium]